MTRITNAQEAVQAWLGGDMEGCRDWCVEIDMEEGASVLLDVERAAKKTAAVALELMKAHCHELAAFLLYMQGDDTGRLK